MTFGSSFGARVHAAVRARGPLCAGIDPHAALLHEWGLDDYVAGLERFALGRRRGAGADVRGREAAVGLLRAVRQPRRRGPGAGDRRVARRPGALVLLDVKRGDIGSTSQAYADAYLDPARPIAADAITVSPYLGFGSLEPFVDTARKHDAGVFVLALHLQQGGRRRSSAPSPRTAGPSPAAWSTTSADLNAGADPLGSFGAVVGATIGETGEDFDFNGPLLAPGYGAQGGTTADLPRIFGSALPHVLASSSRELLRLGPDSAGHARRPCGVRTTSCRALIA